MGRIWTFFAWVAWGGFLQQYHIYLSYFIPSISNIVYMYTTKVWNKFGGLSAINGHSA